MRHFLILLLLFMSVPVCSAQRYKLHAATQGVMVENKGKVVPGKAGMVLTSNDNIVIPSGGYAEVLNMADNHIYRSVQSGRVSVTKLLIEARRSATDKVGSVTDKMRFGKDAGSSGRAIYKEKGMVYRSLQVYDPEGENVQMDVETLALITVAQLLSDRREELPSPLFVQSGPGADGGYEFVVDNKLTYPVYFNVLDVMVDSGSKQVEISKLGQPGGSYVLLPGHAMTRKQHEAPDATCHRMMIITPCQFNLDMLIDEINKILNEDKTMDGTTQAPVHVVPLN